MKIQWLALGIIIMLTGCPMTPATTNQNQSQDQNQTIISPAELLARLAKGDKPFILDVREPAELSSPLGALPNVLNIPLGQLEQRLPEIPRNREVIVVCRSGHRANMAMQILHRKGYTNIRNVEGGMLAIQDQKSTH